MSYVELIEKMSNACGTSGYEDEVVETVKSLLSTDLDVKVDPMNNMEITPKGFEEGKPYIAIDGHIDEVGMMVQHLKPNGLISVVMIGGWDLRNPLSQTYLIRSMNGYKLKALVASIPPHFGAQKKDLKDEDILLDVGASSIEELKELGIEIGCTAVPDTKFSFDRERNIMMGKAFDDRLGSSIVIATMNEASKLGYTQIKGLLSSQEEVGIRGAGVLSKRIHAEKVIVFEGSPADDTLYDSYEAQSVLGKGPQIRLIDKSSIPNPKLIKEVRNIADSKGLKYQISVRRGGGTNVGAYMHSAHATPSCVVAVPVRYIHTNCAIARYDDFEECLKISLAILEDYFS